MGSGGALARSPLSLLAARATNSALHWETAAALV